MMPFLPRICALVCFLSLYSLAAIGEDTITKQIMPPQKGRISTPEDRDNFTLEHPTSPGSGEIPFRPTEGLEKYRAGKAASQAERDGRLRSKSKETRLETINKIDKKHPVLRPRTKDCSVLANESKENLTPFQKECAEKANALMQRKP
jgi:hypothetical protein